MSTSKGNQARDDEQAPVTPPPQWVEPMPIRADEPLPGLTQPVPAAQPMPTEHTQQPDPSAVGENGEDATQPPQWIEPIGGERP